LAVTIFPQPHCLRRKLIGARAAGGSRYRSVLTGLGVPHLMPRS